MVHSRTVFVLGIIIFPLAQVWCQELVDSRNEEEITLASSLPTETVDDYDDYYTDPCSEIEFDCGGGICIDKEKLCNGERNCPNGLDEKNCPTTEPIERTTFPAYENCEDEDFSCAEGECINQSAVCDGILDCSNGEDENACSTSTTTTEVSTDYDYECDEGDFQCDGGLCYPEIVLCDGVQDCGDRLDEMNCTNPIETTTAAQITTLRPSTIGLECPYKGEHYAAGTQIVVNYCSEVTCSETGRILMYNNPDPACSGFTAKPTIIAPCLLLVSILMWMLR